MISRSWKAPDGAALSYLMWEAAGTEKFRVLVLHGMGSTAHEFEVLGDFLAPLGGTVLALNQRSNGLDPDPARRGHAFEWERFREDFRAWFEEAGRPAASEGRPVFLVGESLGALEAILCGADEELGGQLAGVVLLNPVVKLRLETPDWIQTLFRWVARLFPRLVFSPFWFVNRKKGRLALTRETGYQDYLEGLPYRISSYTLSHTIEVGRVIQMADAAAPCLCRPVLHLVGGRDAFLDPEQARSWFERVGADDKTLVEFPEGHHILLHDWDSADVLETIRRWIFSRLPSLPAEFSSL